MKFLHTSDLHIGKTVNGFSMLDDQRAVLKAVLECAGKEKVDAVFLSGDLYDRAVAPAAAVGVLDWFLTELALAGIRVFAIAGNHDCGERLDFGSAIMGRSGVYIQGKPERDLFYADMEDAFGTVRIHLLPFAGPASVRLLYGCPAGDFNESVREQLSHAHLLEGKRNVLLAHHFVVSHGRGPEVCDSDSRLSVGGADQVEASLFEKFNYVALGHLHGPQRIGRGPVYYSGSPLKYSFSETGHKKSVIIGELDGNGAVNIRREPLTPVRDMRKIEGPLKELIKAGNELDGQDPALQDYILAVLTDEGEFVDPIGALRSVYPNVMQIAFKAREEKAFMEEREAAVLKNRDPVSLYREFYRLVTGEELNGNQEEILKEVAQ